MNNLKMCPYLENRDSRCADRLSLERLREAFLFCAGNYDHCTIFHQIRIERRRSEDNHLRARSA